MKRFSFYLLIFYFSVLCSADLTAQELVRPGYSDLIEELQDRWTKSRQAALEDARAKGYPISVSIDRQQMMEIGFFEHNFPAYFLTNALQTSSSVFDVNLFSDQEEFTNPFKRGIIGLSDGGKPRLSHQEFSERVRWIGSQEYDITSHATSMASVMAARGLMPKAKSLSPDAKIESWGWHNDPAQRLQFAADGGFISVHGYDVARGWIRNLFSDGRWAWLGGEDRGEQFDFQFGYYNALTRDIDHVGWMAPHLLMIQSAGNARQSLPSIQPQQHWIYDNGEWRISSEIRYTGTSESGYRTISNLASAKNVLTVGAQISSESDVFPARFSGFGPTSDGRIKPDVLAPGTSIYTAGITGDYNYHTVQGSSLAAAYGASVALNIHNSLSKTDSTFVPLSSTIKALIIHSAQHASDIIGPTYQYGWGTINQEEALEIVDRNEVAGGNYKIRERELRNRSQDEFQINATGSEPLKVTLAWTDLPARRILDAGTRQARVLSHDLDIRITDPDGVTHKPFVLDPANPEKPATRNDNFRDNVEQVFIEDPQNGEYTVSISHKRSLSQAQPYSLIMTGIESPVSHPVRFIADMSIQEEMGHFDRKTDQLYVMGDFSNWTLQHSAQDSLFLMQPEDTASSIFTATTTIQAWPDQNLSYKLYSPDNQLGWEINELEEPGQTNRSIQVASGEELVETDTLFFNNEFETYLLQDVRFKINMEAAHEIGIFKPQNGDAVYVRGDFNNWARTELNKLERGEEFYFTSTLPVKGSPEDTVNYLYFIETGDGRSLPNDGWEIIGQNQNRTFVLSGADSIQHLDPVLFSDDPGLALIGIHPAEFDKMAHFPEFISSEISLINSGDSDLNWNLDISYREATDAFQQETELLLGQRLNRNPFTTQDLTVIFSDDFSQYYIDTFVDATSKWITPTNPESGIYLSDKNPYSGQLHLHLKGNNDEPIELSSYYFLHQQASLYDISFAINISEYDGADYSMWLGNSDLQTEILFHSNGKTSVIHHGGNSPDSTLTDFEWFAEWYHEMNVLINFDQQTIRITADEEPVYRSNSFDTYQLNRIGFFHNNENDIDFADIDDITIKANIQTPAWMLANTHFGNVTADDVAQIKLIFDSANLREEEYEANLVFRSNAPNSPVSRIPVQFSVLPERQDVSPYLVKDLSFRSYMMGGGPYYVDLTQAFEHDEGESFSFNVISTEPSNLRADIIFRRVQVERDEEIVTERRPMIRLEPLGIGDASIVIQKTDESGNESIHQFMAEVQPKLPPTVVREIPDFRLITGRSPRIIPLNDFFTDPAGHALDYKFEVSGTRTLSVEKIDLGSSRSRFSIPGMSWMEDLIGISVSDQEYMGPALVLSPEDRGEVDIVVTALDPFGESVSHRFRVQVIEDEAPFLANRPEAIDVLIQNSVTEFSIEDVFEDPDGGELSITVQSQNEDIAIAAVVNTSQFPDISDISELQNIPELRGTRISSVMLSSSSVLLIRPIQLGQTTLYMTAVNDIGRETEVVIPVRVLSEPDPIGPFSLRNPDDFFEATVSGSPDREFSFSWTKSETSLSIRYEVLFDIEQGDFTNPIHSIRSNNSGRDTVLTLTMSDFDDILSELNINRQSYTAFDWTVIAKANNRNRYASTRQTLNINRGIVGEISFANLRGPEVRDTRLGTNANISGTVTAEGFTGLDEESEFLQAWIGVYHENIAPELWPESAWMEATFRQSDEDSDIYEIEYGENLTEGTYFAASRFRLVGQNLHYGGFSEDGGGFWHAQNRPVGRITFREMAIAASQDVPTEFILQQNFPNPFNPSTQIRYGLPEAADVRLSVYNMLGQEINALVSQYQNSGWYTVTFDATGMTSGTYIYRLRAGDYVKTMKMLYVR